MADALRATARSLLVVTMKLVALTARPSGVATRIGPVVAPAGTVARISVEETFVNGALRLLKETLVTLKKLVPLIVTGVPTGPSVGEKAVRFGSTRKRPVLMITPPGVLTVSGPVVALVGRTAVSLLDALTMMLWAAPVLNKTSETATKLAPVMTMLLPTMPLVGVKLVSRGGTWKILALALVPAVVVTVIGPLVALVGTVA